MSNLTLHNDLANKLAVRLGIDNDPQDLINVLKGTAFKGNATDAQMSALLIVSNQFGLNPWTKEIYAFPDKGGGIVPVVGVDGWLRIINDHPQFDGMDVQLSADGEEATCTIHRKDREHPTKITEYLSECKRGTDPWKTSPRRMLRHKAIIQCARVAFGYGGIHDQDEAQSIVDMGTIDGETGEVRPAAKMPGSKKEKATRAQGDTDGTIDVQATEVPEKQSAPPEKEAKPETTKAPAQASDTGERASIGEKRHVELKLQQAGIDKAAAMEACGITDFDNLSRDGFVCLLEHAKANTK